MARQQSMHLPLPHRRGRLAALLALALPLLSACSGPGPRPTWVPGWAWWGDATAPLAAQAPVTEAAAPPVARKEVLVGITTQRRLVTFSASAPQTLLSRVPLVGLLPGEHLVGIDHRVARGQLFGLSSAGRLLRIDIETGALTPVGAGVRLPVARTFGFDFNPTVDRIRVVSDAGHNLRLHPDTGAQVDGDPGAEGLQPDSPLAYAQGDAQSQQPPRLVAAGYTYNKDSDKLTTNYAIDAARGGHLVVQGSIEGGSPVVSPNTGQLRTVGPLRIQTFDHASFDIADVNNRAYLVTGRIGSTAARLYEVNLSTGQAGFIGLVGSPAEREHLGALVALAVVP